MEEFRRKSGNVAVVILMFKKGNSKKYQKHHRSTARSVVCKVYEQILENKGCGFRKCRSIQDDQINVIRQITEKIDIQNNEAYLAFIHLEKTFWPNPTFNYLEKLWKQGVKKKLIKAEKVSLWIAATM